MMGAIVSQGTFQNPMYFKLLWEERLCGLMETNKNGKFLWRV